MTCNNQNLYRLLLGVGIILGGFGITVCSVHVANISEEGEKILDKFGVLIMVLGAISVSRWLSKIDMCGKKPS